MTEDVLDDRNSKPNHHAKAGEHLYPQLACELTETFMSLGPCIVLFFASTSVSARASSSSKFHFVAHFVSPRWNAGLSSAAMGAVAGGVAAGSSAAEVTPLIPVYQAAEERRISSIS